MKHSNVKFFTVFVAGILFSAFTVFAATISVNTDFTQDAVQYLQSLVLTDSSGTTGIVLDGSGKKIHTDIICNSSGNQCKNIADIFTGNEADPVFMASAASGITSSNISNWNTAHGWGNHSAESYLTSETDPIFNSHSGDYYLNTNPNGYITNDINEDIIVGPDYKIYIGYTSALDPDTFASARNTYNTIKLATNGSIYMNPIDDPGNTCTGEILGTFYFDQGTDSFKFCQIDSDTGLPERYILGQ